MGGTSKRREYVAPLGKTEEDFCGIFGEILGLERVSAEDDFFELGGSSVIAMKVVIAAGKKGYSIVYNDVFTYTTPRLLAEFVTGSASQTEEITAAIAPSAGKITEVDSEGYDYSAINALLAKNTMEAFRSGERQRLGDVLLAGATGYLGIHVLEEILTSTESKVFCLIRPKEGTSGEKRLKNLLEYYFGHDHAEYFDSRITVIEGDATTPDSLKGFKPDSQITVINCAASVKHFAKGNEIEHTNVDSVKNLAAWCEENNSRLVHISTGSIIGGRKNGFPPEGYRFDEHVLFAGQTVSHNQCNAITPKSPAMILYTSGTTGRPKGVLHRHEFLTHIIDWMNIGGGFEMSEAVSRIGRNDVKNIVVCLRNVSRNDYLVCYYESGNELNESEISAVKAEISKYLADYMIPDIFMRVAQMPRNLNGKIIRKDLPQPKSHTHEITALDSEVLARVVWTAGDVLGISSAEPEDTFTELGGSSITAMKLAALLRPQGIKITTAQILKLNVLRKIADNAEVDYAKLWSEEDYSAIIADFASRGEHIQKVLPITAQQDGYVVRLYTLPRQKQLQVYLHASG